MDRVIAQRLKPMLMREILFGSLKQGGEMVVNSISGEGGTNGLVSENNQTV